MMAYNEDSSGSGHDEPWIQWFCGLKGHEMFCEVERSFIEDGFNLYGLRASVNNFSDCLDLILDRIGPDDSDDSHLTQNAFTLYGLIHARYIVTAHGLDAMYNKYAAKEFGTCPLVQCQGQPVLPLGLKDEVGYDTVEIFCPKCQCVYHPPPLSRRGGVSAVDGASFGTTFAHLFLMTFSNLVPDPLTPDSIYVPRIFGFRVHPSARQRPITAAAAAVFEANINNCGTNPSVAITAAATSTIKASLGSEEILLPQSSPSLPVENDHNNASKLPAALPVGDNSTAVSAIHSEPVLPEISNENGTRNGEAEEKCLETRQQGKDEYGDGNDNCIDSNSKLAQQQQNIRKRTPDYGEIINNKSSLKQSKRKKQQSIVENI